MIKRILPGIGGAPFTNVAIPRAVELCKIHEAQLNPWPGAILRLLSCSNDMPDADRWLSDASICSRQHGFETDMRFRAGSPGEQILSEAAEWDADLIVLGMSRASVF